MVAAILMFGAALSCLAALIVLSTCHPLAGGVIISGCFPLLGGIVAMISARIQKS